MDAGAKSVHGVDLDERGLEKFGERLKRYAGTHRPTFSRSSSGKKIGLPDHSFDCIVCFDVMEHVMDYCPASFIASVVGLSGVLLLGSYVLAIKHIFSLLSVILFGAVLSPLKALGIAVSIIGVALLVLG